MKSMGLLKISIISGIIAMSLACVDKMHALRAPFDQADYGTISGTVVNEAGSPLEGARVHLGSDIPTMAAVRYVTTDQAGHFTMDKISWGTYKVFVDKESEQYGDTGAAFYSGNKLYVATVTPAKPTANVTVSTGPPCGTLSVEHVTDAVSGKPLNPQITVWRDSDRGLFLSVANRTGEVLIPSNVKVDFSLRAPGYEPWPPSSSQASKEGHILMKPRQFYAPDIRLQPTAMPLK